MAISGESQSKRKNSNAHAASRNPASRSPLLLSDWARRLAPQLDVVSASSPEPMVEDGTVVAVFTSTDDARELMLSWERLESADQSVGFVALGRAPDASTASSSLNPEGADPEGADPEGVVKDAAVSAASGGLIGAGIGLLVALIIGLVVGWGSGAIVGLIAAPALGAVAGAVIVFVLRSGWGEGYMQSFVDPKATALEVCAISVREATHRGPAIAAARDASALEVMVVDASGRARRASA